MLQPTQLPGPRAGRPGQGAGRGVLRRVMIADSLKTLAREDVEGLVTSDGRG
jgi:hypothetical protein